MTGLDGHIDGILDFRSFAECQSVETPVVRGFNDLFWFDFRDAAVRDAYVVDPEHQTVGARIVAETEGGPDGVYVFGRGALMDTADRAFLTAAVRGRGAGRRPGDRRCARICPPGRRGGRW